MKIGENRSILGQDLSKLVVDYQNLRPGGLKSMRFSGFSHFSDTFLIIFWDLCAKLGKTSHIKYPPLCRAGGASVWGLR